MEPELVLGGDCDPVFQSLISFHLDAVFNPLWPSEEACEDNCILGCHMYRSRYLLLNVLPKLNPEKYYNRQIPKGITHLILFTPKPIFNVSQNRNSSSTGELHILIINHPLHPAQMCSCTYIPNIENCGSPYLLTRMLLKVLCNLLSRCKNAGRIQCNLIPQCLILGWVQRFLSNTNSCKTTFFLWHQFLSMILILHVSCHVSIFFEHVTSSEKKRCSEMNLISELNLLSALVQDPRWTFSLLLFLLPPCFPFFLFLCEQYYLYYNLYSDVITQFFCYYMSYTN